MHVLVCDDDKTTRFVINRLLVQRLKFTVTEVCDGVEVLQAIRRSQQFARLPVIMLSHERRAEVVTKLIHLGIVGYVTKPPTAESLLAVIERARVAKAAESQRAEIRLAAETPALLVDGDAEYRRYFVTHAEAYGKLTAIESGLTALAEFKRDPARLVFVGSQLGVVGRDVLIHKLREMRKDHPLRIVQLRAANEPGPVVDGADDVMSRTLKIPEHRQALRPFVRAIGPLDDLYALTGNLAEALTAASTQVFGMMLDTEVHSSTALLGDTDVSATFELTVRHQYLVRLDFCFTRQDAARVVARSRSQGTAVSEQDVTTTLTELLTLVRQRLQTTIAARHVECECSSPRVKHLESMEMEIPLDGHGLQLSFATTTGESFVLLAKITKGSRHAAVA